MDEDGGAINVFEAVLAALLIVGALFYWNVLQQPDFEDPGAGAEMDRLAARALEGILADPPGTATTLDAWAFDVLDGANDGSDMDASMELLLPPGTVYAVRLNTGAGVIHLAPDGEGDRLPRAGGSAATFIQVDLQTTPSGVMELYPGQAAELDQDLLGFSLFCDFGAIRGPHDAPSDPLPHGPVDPERHGGMTSWSEVWNAADGTVPVGIPYGAWSIEMLTPPGPLGAVLCPNAATATVVISAPDGSGGALPPSQHIVYALELVVWPGG